MPVTYEAAKCLSAQPYDSSRRRVPEDRKLGLRRALSARIQPPLLKGVTNPLTNERGHKGRDMPLITWDVAGGADWVGILCQPKALGPGRWVALETLSFPSLAQIEAHGMKVVLRAGSPYCPPVIIGIGACFDAAARVASKATMRPIGTTNPEPVLRSMEERLLRALNATGFGPMGTGGDTTALAVQGLGLGLGPVTVGIDAHGNSLFDSLLARARMPGILADLAARHAGR